MMNAAREAPWTRCGARQGSEFRDYKPTRRRPKGKPMASTSDKAAAALAVAQRISAALMGIPAARMSALDATAAGVVSAESSSVALPAPTAVPAPSAAAAGAPTAALSALQRAAQAAARLQGINQQGADNAAARAAAAAATAAITAPQVEYPFREIDINQCIDRSALTLRATHDNVRIASATEYFVLRQCFC